MLIFDDFREICQISLFFSFAGRHVWNFRIMGNRQTGKKFWKTDKVPHGDVFSYIKWVHICKIDKSKVSLSCFPFESQKGNINPKDSRIPLKNNFHFFCFSFVLFDISNS